MKNNLKAQLGGPVFGETLYDEKFYFRAIKKWESAYLTVEKINQMEEIPMGSVRELKAYALNFWLHSVGYENLLHRMKLERGLGRITKSQEKELKRTFRQISNYKKGEARGLIEELDRKVKMVSANYR